MILHKYKGNVMGDIHMGQLIRQCKLTRYKVSFWSHEDETVQLKSNTYRYSCKKRCELFIRLRCANKK